MSLNSNEIQKILPHRYPFLLVDRIDELEPGVRAKGVKCITANEMQFLGHFPQQHVMPGRIRDLPHPQAFQSPLKVPSL